MKLKNLRDRHCENNDVKLIHRACVAADDFPLPIFEADFSNMMFIEDIGTCAKRETQVLIFVLKLDSISHSNVPPMVNVPSNFCREHANLYNSSSRAFGDDIIASTEF